MPVAQEPIAGQREDRMAAQINPTEVLGGRLLREIAAEEGSLEDLLKDLRTLSNHTRPSRTGLPDLDDLWKQHGGKLSIIGQGLPLIYTVITHLVHTLGGTIVVIDLDGRFSPSHLTELSVEGLRDIHVFRCSKERLKVTLESVEGYMLWGEHWSKGREWLSTIILGGVGGDIMVGWRGWLGVEREMVRGFAEGFSVEEAWGEKEGRQEVVDTKGWRGVCEMGEFSWV